MEGTDFQIVFTPTHALPPRRAREILGFPDGNYFALSFQVGMIGFTFRVANSEG